MIWSLPYRICGVGQCSTDPASICWQLVQADHMLGSCQSILRRHIPSDVEHQCQQASFCAGVWTRVVSDIVQLCSYTVSCRRVDSIWTDLCAQLACHGPCRMPCNSELADLQVCQILSRLSQIPAKAAAHARQAIYLMHQQSLLGAKSSVCHSCWQCSCVSCIKAYSVTLSPGDFHDKLEGLTGCTPGLLLIFNLNTRLNRFCWAMLCWWTCIMACRWSDLMQQWECPTLSVAGMRLAASAVAHVGKPS